jgi:HEAT repeat protein
MKKALSMIMIFLAVLAFSDEVSSVWERLYFTAESESQKLAIMQNIVQQDSREMVPMLQEALSELNIAGIETGTFNEIQDRIALAILLVDELGDLQAREASEEIYRVIEENQDPFLRGRAIYALGKMRAMEFSEQLLLLEYVNIVPDEGLQEKETLAFYLVLAFEQMKMEAAFTPVFFASIGWYSNASNVKTVAKRALESITDDPTEPLINIIETTQEISNKFAALRVAQESSASDENKALIAAKALELGHRDSARDRIAAQNLSRLRKLALEMLIETGDQTDTNVRWLALSTPTQLALQEDRDEVLLAINALGVNASAPAVDTLSGLLYEYNERQRNGLNTNWDLDKTKAIILALGRTGSPEARDALIQVEFSNFSPNMVREAKRALNNL